MSEEEAIEYLKNYTIWNQTQGFSKGNNDKAIDTVLKALEKKDRQLEERTNRIRNLEKECQKYFDNMMETIKELSNKEAIIDEMTKTIIKLREDSENDCFIPKSYRDINGCIETTCDVCVKEYFIKLVEDK